MAGFSSKENAFVQAVKELFENALDATLDSNVISVLRIEIVQLKFKSPIEIICHDVGTGMAPSAIKKLCGQAFNSTKTNAGMQFGQFGVGMKAATLYCQKHLPSESSCLGITTTEGSQAGKITHTNIKINADENTGSESVVDFKSSVFQIEESHQSFSGTRVCLKFPPSPKTIISKALVKLISYFETFKVMAHQKIEFDLLYTNQSSGTTSLVSIRQEPDGTLEDTIKSAIISSNSIESSELFTCEYALPPLGCLAVATIVTEEFNARRPKGVYEIPIELIRYANGVPLLIQDDIYNCAITKAIYSAKAYWKSMGWTIKKSSTGGDSEFKTPLTLVSTLSNRKCENGIRYKLVLVYNICKNSGTLAFHSLAKTTLVENDLQKVCFICLEGLVTQLRESYPDVFQTTTEQQEDEILQEHLPLIANAFSEIASNAASETMKGVMLETIGSNSLYSKEYAKQVTVYHLTQLMVEASNETLNDSLQN